MDIISIRSILCSIVLLCIILMLCGRFIGDKYIKPAILHTLFALFFSVTTLFVILDICCLGKGWSPGCCVGYFVVYGSIGFTWFIYLQNTINREVTQMYITKIIWNPNKGTYAVLGNIKDCIGLKYSAVIQDVQNCSYQKGQSLQVKIIADTYDGDFVVQPV